jgi:hypothetical protein
MLYQYLFEDIYLNACVTGWGDTFVTLMAGVIILNLLSGPPMFKSSLIATGEARHMLSKLLISSKEADEYEQVWREV